jgi:uncharacterized metal-binding protein YceD (DUF177 family)
MNRIDEYLKQFDIQFSGLKIGHHVYSFEIGPLFFERFKIEDIDGGNISVVFTLEKRENMMDLGFQLSGVLQTFCDRCLEPLEIPIETQNELIVKFGQEHNEEDDELLILAPEEYKLDIAPIIYEFLSLQVPLRKVHPEDACNPEILAKLKHQNEEEKNEETPSIWDKLKNLN